MQFRKMLGERVGGGCVLLPDKQISRLADRGPLGAPAQPEARHVIPPAMRPDTLLARGGSYITSFAFAPIFYYLHLW